MHKTRFVTDIFGKICKECDNIMFGFKFDLIDSINIKLTMFPDGGSGRCGDNP